MAEPTLKPFDGQLDPVETSAVKPFTGTLDGETPGLAARVKQGASRAFDSASTALTDDPNKIAQIASEQARTALPQSDVRRKMAEEFAPYVDEANKAEGVVDNVKAWGAAGLKRAGQLVSNPGETAKMIAEQLPNSLPGMAGGIAGAKLGAMAGTAVMPGVGTAIGGLAGGVLGGFAGGYGLEKGAAMQDQVQKEAQAQRIDLQDESAVARMVALKQPEFDAAAQRKGVGTAGTDALLNVATMGLAGVGGRTLAKEARTLAQAVKAGTISAADAAADVARLQAANAARNTLGAKALRGAGVVGAEMGGEGLSEGVGQKFAYGNVDAGEVIDESLMGLGTGGAMALGSKAFNKAAGIVDQDATTQNIAAASDGLGALGPAFTTAPGAVDPNAAQAPVAQAPEAPDLSTTLGAGVPRDGVPFTRDIDTSGLAVEDRGAMERARAAMVDYQPGDTTPQWETSMGATAARQGLDMPAPEFDAGTLGLESQGRALTPSERMGINPAAGALSRAAAVAVDSGATPVQFLGATGRDLQARATGPGVTNESNVIDVQGRLVEDRAISTPRRLTDQQDGMAARAQGDRLAIQPPAAPSAVPALGGPVGADAARGGTTAVPDGVADGRPGGGSAEGNGTGAAEAGAARAGGRGNSNPALSAPTNLREGLARMRARRQEAADAQTAAQSAPTSAPAVSAARPGAVEAAGAAPFPATTGVNREPSPTQAIQASAQPAQTGPAPAASDAVPGAQGSAAAPAPVGSGEPAAGLTNAATPQNNGAQAAPATGAQAQAPGNASWAALTPEQRRRARLEHEIATGQTNNGGVVAGLRPSAIEKRKQELAAMGDAGKLPSPGPAEPLSADGLAAQGQAAPGAQGAAQAAQAGVAPRPKNWRTSMLGATPVAKAMGIDTNGKRLAQVVAEIDARDTQAPATPAPAPTPGPTRLGRDNTPLSEGGKPFKTRKAAGDAKKLQPMMRVVTVPGGYALAEKTPAQLAAEERAAKRLRTPRTSPAGKPVPAHAFIAASGGLHMRHRNDLGVDGNPRIGNRRMFGGLNRGLSIEQATEMLVADGYLSEGASHNDAYALIKKSLSQPQYNADGIERIAQAESDAQFEDYMAAQEEAAAEGDMDPFDMAGEFTSEELDDVGYASASPALQAEVNALIAQADAMDIDTYAILEDIARTYANATQDQYNAAARDALAAAIARSNQDGGSAAAQAAPAAEPAAEQGLNRPSALTSKAQAATENVAPEALELAAQTPAEAAARQDAQEQADKAEAAAKRAEDAAAKAEEERKRIAQASVRAADRFELGQDPMDSLTGQGGLMFSRAPAGGQTETAAFKRWFGESKVVDADGKPLVVYHGSTSGGISNATAQNTFFTPNRDVASSYALDESASRSEGQLVVNPVYIRIENPLVVDAYGAPWMAIQFEGGSMTTDGIAAIAKERGHDGVIIKNVEDNVNDEELPPADIYITLGKRGQIKSATGNNGSFDPTNPDIRFSFAGARAATADKHALVTAQDRLSAGEDAETVRQETGWFQGNDGKWRFEISDAGAQLAQQVYFAERGKWYPSRFLADARDHGSDTGGTGTLGDVLEHPALFAAYPALRDMPVTAKIRKDQESGAFDGRSITATAENEGRLLSVLLHEIQHGIQNIEGFATGGNTEQFGASHAEELRQRLVHQAAMVKRAKENGGVDPITGQDSAFLSQLAAATANELIPYTTTKRPEDRYRRLAGEVEARNTQARQKLTADQRRVTSPGSTADVADADVIVVFNGKEMANAPMPANAAPDAATTAQPLRTPAATIRAAITKAYGKLLVQLESKGLVTLTQTDDEAIEAAAQARAAKTGQSVERERAALRASVKNSVADQTQTENFQRWFKDSKVVDADGKPLVMYHGTSASEQGDAFSSFDTYASNYGLMGQGGYFTADPEVASSYTTKGKGATPSVYPVYLAIKNPIDMDAQADPVQWQKQFDGIEDFHEGGTTNESWYRAAEDMLRDQELPMWEGAEIMQDGLRSMGFDGITHEGGGRVAVDGVRHRVYIAFDPEQIKSATGNNGQFDPANPDIRRSADGSIQGFFDPQTGQSFLIADNLTAEAAPGVLMHEVGIHMAADGSMKALFNRAAMMLKLQRGNPFMKAVQDRMDAAGETSGEEAAAYIAEAYENDRANAPASVQRWLADLLAAVKAWMFKKGIMGADRLTVADIAAVARANARSMARDGGATGGQGFGTAFSRAPAGDQTQTDSFKRWFAGSRVVEADGKPLVVYHGTRRPFNEFSPSKPRGAPGNPDGVYFTADKGVAEEYAQDADGAWDEKSRVVSAYIKIENDADGKVIDSAYRGREYVVFKAENIKSAIGNSGAFDPANPDIRFSRTSTATGTQSAWDAPVQTGFDDVIYKLQDKNIDLKRVVESITKSAGQVADSVNAYLKEELFHKRAAKRVEDFGARELKPLMNQMRLMGLGMEDVEEYLHARHAKEANAVIAQRNPGEPGLQDGGSGMTNQAADNYFAKLDPAQRRKLEAVAKNVDAIIDKTRKLYVSYGLENQDVVDGWASMYQHYIPLMREDKEGGMGTGQGFSVKGKETKGRTGSTRKVVDILANIASQREKLIVRGEKNQVTQALIGLARANPNSDFWEVRSQAPTERVFDPKKGIVVDRPDPLFKSRDNVVVAKVQDSKGNVTEQMVVFNEDNPRAVRMAAAMKNLDAGNLEGLLGMSAKITRYFSAINTQYNPVFGVVNLVRDVQGAMVNLAATPLAGQQGKIARDTVSALAGIYSDIRKTRKGGQASSKWAQLWEQMQDDGGTTGYRELFTNSADRANNLKSILNPQGWMDSKWGKVFTADGKLRVPMSMAQKGASEIFGWLSDYNEAMENGVRLAAYKAALDMGMSREQAASLAKNLTVNFNRKGQVGMQAGAVYAFFNAAMQGTARIGQTLFDMDGGDISTLRLSKTGKAVVYGGVTLGVMQALALAGAGFDEEDPPEFVRERSLIIPTGGKTYVSIPMPLGLHVIPGIGRHATEFALSGFDKPAKRALSVIGMFADAFNPIGNAGLSMQTLAPTALDPLVALTENKDWTGKPIARVSSNKALPGHTQWKDTATWYSKMAAEAINWVSGGNEYVAGALSPTPDQIDYLIAQVGGGVAREASKVFQAASTTVNGEELPTYKIPLLGRFAGNAASQASQGTAFYANLDKLNALETEIKGLRKDGRFGEAAQLARENPQAAMIPMANRAERDVQKLRRDKRELIATGATREEVRAKEAQITAVMARLNEAAARRKATSPE